MRTLVDAFAGVNSAVETYNDTVDREFGNITAAIEKYNEVLEQAESFREEIVGDMEAYMDERSENWPDSERGQAYGEWKDGWDDIDLSLIDIPEPEPLEVEFDNHGEDLEALQEDLGL